MKFLSSSNKGKTVVRIIAIVIAALLIFSTLAAVLPAFVGAQSDEYTQDKIISVGLYYGASAVSSVALTSDTGFDIGIFDKTSKVFTTVTSFDGTALMAVIDAAGTLSVVTPEWNGVYTPAEYGASVYIRAKNAGTVCASGKIYTGLLEFTPAGTAMRVVNLTYLEDYVKGVVVSEVFTQWPMETLKSQAIVARSFILYTGSKHSADGFDICSSQHCQAYNGIGNAVEATNAAVDATRGLVVAYNGKPALTTYHSSSGDTTESAASAWGGDPDRYPYLTSVATGFNETESYKNGRWSYTVSASELTAYINSKPEYAGILEGDIETITCESLGNSAYVYKITVADSFGNEISVEKSTHVKSFIGQYCKSACFRVSSHLPVYAGDCEERMIDSENMYVITAGGEKTLSAPAGKIEVLTSGGLKVLSAPQGKRVFTITGEGYGHGVGMSQYGAMTLAEKGYDYNYILGLYYPGTVIADYRTLG